MRWGLSFNHFWARTKRLFYCLHKTVTTGRFVKPIDAHTYIRGELQLLQLTTSDDRVFWEQ